jgi:Fe-S-cluster containining protein
VAQVAVNFWASPGATVMDSQTGRVFQIGTITPRLHEGRCVFLDDRDRCTVHPVAPFGCAYFDAHQTENEGQRRSGWALRLILDTPAYAEQRMALPSALSWNPRTY